MINKLLKTIFMMAVIMSALPIMSQSFEGKSEFKDIVLHDTAVLLVFDVLPQYDVKQVGKDLLVEAKNCVNLYEYKALNVNNGYVGKVNVDSLSDKSKIKIKFDMLKEFSYATSDKDNTIQIVFADVDLNGSNVQPEKKEVTVAQKMNTVTEKKKAAETKKKSKKAEQKRQADLMDRITKELVSLDFNQADIKDVLRLLSAKSGVNMIYGEDVTGSVTMHLENVPFNEAFNTILSLKGLVVQQVGDNILRVLKPQTLTDERAKAATFTKVIQLNYAEASQIKSNLDSVRQAEGRKGIIEIDARTNALVITDTPEGLVSIEKLILDLDTKPKQVLIEAKIVEVSDDDALNLGINWAAASGTQGVDDVVIGGTKNDSTSIYGDGLPELIKPGDSEYSGGTGVNIGNQSSLVNLTLAYIKDDNFLEAQLSAYLKQTKIKLLSNPKITTINNKLAKISIIDQVPYNQTTVSEGVTTTETVFADVGITLEVTPTINADNRITLKIMPEVSEVTDTTSAGPAISRRKAETTVLIANGETLVIGGLIKELEQNIDQKVPLLGDLPILGYLFKNKDNRQTRKELLVFITPRIIVE